MFFLPLAQSEDRDRLALWLKRPPGCIHPNGSELLFLRPLTKRCPLKHWAVRWEVTLIAPLHLLSTTRFPPSLSITHSHTFLSSLFSLFLPSLQWHFGLLIWLQERSFADPRCHGYHAHAWIAAGNHSKYTVVKTKDLCSPWDTDDLFLRVPPHL